MLPDAVLDYQPAHLLVLVSLLAALSWGFWKLLLYPVLLDPLRHVPGPKGGFLILGAWEHLKRPVSKKLFEWMTTIPNHGLIRLHYLPGNYHYIPTSPKIVSELLVTKAYDFQKPEEGRDILRLILGDGLVVTEGDVHRFQRKNVNPLFSFRHIKELYPLMWSKSLELVSCVKADLMANGNEKASREVEIYQWASRATLDIIGVAALGRNLNTLHSSDDQLARIYEWVMRVDFQKKLWFLAHLLFPKYLVYALPWKVNRETAASSDGLRQVCRQFVSDKRIALADEADNSADILAKLIKSNNFSDTELVDQLLTMLAAGHETTSSMFTWTLAMLARYPEYQSKLREELSAIIDLNNPAPPSAADLESLPLLNAICNETLRLYPAVPHSRRVSIRDTNLGGIHIPRGTYLLMPIWWWNRMPQLWGDSAASFVPERWINEESGKPNNSGGADSNYALMTFLHGPHSCIGQGFAKAELRTLVAAWLMNFEFKMARDGQQLVEEGNVTVKPKGGLWLQVKAL